LLVSGDAQQATVRPSLELASFAEAGQLAACMSVNNSILQKFCCKFVLWLSYFLSTSLKFQVYYDGINQAEHT
jgi:hypothetical protein